MEFLTFKRQFQAHVDSLVRDTDQLFLTDVSKDAMWEAYLSSFPVEEQQEHNCNACKSFIRAHGNLVAIKDNQLVSIWGFAAEDQYKSVVNSLNELVLSAPIRDVFLPENLSLGLDSNVQLLEDKTTIEWQHLYYKLPGKFSKRRYYSTTLDGERGELRQAKQVFRRSLDTIPASVTETVLELIEQDSLYRGAEFAATLRAFLSYQTVYSCVAEDLKDNYCWANFASSGVAKIRNSAIGTLLVDIADGMELDQAVARYRSVMDPHNYHRPKPVVTAKMISDAEKKVAELGLSDSLPRRFATISDITVNDILFVNRNLSSASAEPGLFDSLREDLPINPRQLKKVEEVTLDKFLNGVLPSAKSVRLLLESRLTNRLVSLIAPVNRNASPVTKWSNNFTWCYMNNLADSDIAQKVKAAGGKTEGLLRISLAWYTHSDLDLHVHEYPSGDHIYYAHKFSSYSKAELDVDMNASSIETTDTPVENVIYPYGACLPKKIKVEVNNFNNRQPTSSFDVEIEYQGQIYNIHMDKTLRSNQSVEVVSFTINPDELIFDREINSSNSSMGSVNTWGLDTNKFCDVEAVMFSPNHWEDSGSGIGNKHTFFMLKGAYNPGPVRGLFNEFLKPELVSHKRVFELLGGKMKVEDSPSQLSGVGFSSSGNEGHFYVEVESNFKRTLKVTL